MGRGRLVESGVGWGGVMRGGLGGGGSGVEIAQSHQIPIRPWQDVINGQLSVMSPASLQT